ncbi:YsnF/AvaK domain-containing protein [Planococcus ruber]|uniref:YsnF/AvaK domain-containing protein n=1 Tax=Planococcus ruber TaxID=2027871 RepID=UPI001FEF1AC1|nr:YsnF/AvaK domain-containing protein [Planococcus ruber]MCJ1907794.1 YsnF/AvaK domain-containing protein [Planococcus ruber]
MAKRENTFIGTFDVQAEVLSKITELKSQGYREEDMYVIAQDEDQLTMIKGQTDVKLDTQEDQGFMGRFISTLAGETSSFEAFNSMGLDSEESDTYKREVENGKILLYVDSEYGPSYDRYTETRANTAGTGSVFTNDTSASTTDEERLRLHEEQLRVDKERVQTGEVNVGKHVVEDTQTIEVPVEREEVYIERRPVNEATDSATAGGLTGKDAYQDGENIHIPISEERVEVSKTDVVSEEIVVGKRKVQDTEQVTETTRREVADIDEDNDSTTNGRKPL